MNSRERIYSIVSLGIAIVMLLTAVPVSAATITEKAPYTWAGTSGDTKVHGVFAYDVDGDSTTEVITVGESYTGTKTEAQLGIWNWDGDLNITRETLYNWTNAPNATVTIAYDVFVDDLDQDSTVDIVVCGKTGNATASDYMLKVFHWDGSNLTSEDPAIEALAEAFYSVYAANITNDSKLEIVASGMAAGSGGTSDDDGTLWLWGYNSSRVLDPIFYISSTNWATGSGEGAIAYGVFSGNVDSDATIEIVTGGYFTNTSLSDRAGEMRVWNYTSSQFGLEAVDIQQPEGAGLKTEWFGVFADDFDDNDDVEIAVCGYSHEQNFWDWGYLAVYELEDSGWTYKQSMKTRYQSGGDYHRKSVYATNMNGDDLIEIVTGGWGDDGTRDNGRVTVWKYEEVNDIATITLLDDTGWYTQGDTAVNGVYSLDLGGDSDHEIVSGGKAYDTINSRSIGEMKIFEFS
jgi:hypothetical protein